MKIVNSGPQHLKKIARIHKSAFPQKLSSALGIAFICKNLEWYLENPNNGFILHLESDNEIIGYVTAFYNDGSLINGSATTITQYSYKIGIISFLFRPWLIFHPEIIQKWSLLFKQFKLLISNILSINDTKMKPGFNKIVKSRTCGLLSIGICSGMQGKGYGALLISAFEEQAVKRFLVNSLELSVMSDNMNARKAYEKSGWVLDKIRGSYCYMYKVLTTD